MRLCIRQFKKSDLPELQLIERVCFKREAYPPELFLSYSILHPNTFLVAELEGKVIGYTIGRKLDELAEVISIAVLPEFRRRGIGSALWLRLRDELKEMGVKTVRLHVRVSNEPAIRFYEKFGFERTRLEPSYYSDGEDAWLMKLEKL